MFAYVVIHRLGDGKETTLYYSSMMMPKPSVGGLPSILSVILNRALPCRSSLFHPSLEPRGLVRR